MNTSKSYFPSCQIKLTATSPENEASDGYLDLFQSQRDRQTQELYNLTHLSLHLDTSLVWIILITLKPGNLTSFSISSFESSLGGRTTPLRNATLKGWAFNVRSLMPKLQRIEVCGLQKNAAHLPKWRDEVHLPGFRKPREVCLMEPPPESAVARSLEGVGAAILNYARWSQSWGAKVEHLRIDNVDVDRTCISDRLSIDPAQLRKLKVLVIRGFPRHRRGEWVWEAQDEGKTYGRLGRPLPPPDERQGENKFLEWRIADAIRQLDLPSLRMIVIDDYHFWVWRLSDYGDSVRPPQQFPTIPMSDAMGMKVHADTIATEMKKWDWDFIMNVSSVLSQDAREEFRKAASKAVFRR